MSHLEEYLINPFFGNRKCDEEMDQSNYYKYYKNIYLIQPINKIENFWFEKNITQEQLDTIYKNCIVIKKHNSIGKIDIFYKMMKTINTRHLLKCNVGHLEFEDDIQLILPLFNFTYQEIIPFLDSYDNEDWFHKLLIKHKIKEFFNINSNFLEFKDNLNSSPQTYWNKYNNCNIDTTKLFMDRKMKWNIYRSLNTEIEKTYTDMRKYNLENDNYLMVLFKSKGIFDSNEEISSNLNRLPRIDKLINQEQLNEFIKTLSGKNKFKLFCNLLVTPQYCHLILNNGYIWDYMKPFVDASLPLIKYCLFYAYLSLYLQEIIKKTNLRKEDTCILKLSNACKIPNFPYIQSYINSHPALAAGCLINKKAINSKNFYGIACSNINRLNNMEEFKTYLNLFITGTDKNILKDVDFTDLHMTGSMITACVPNNPQLLNLFPSKNFTETFNKYIDEYYMDSDIDVLVTIRNPIELKKRVLQFKNEIQKNLDSKEPVTITHTYRGYININTAFIRKKLIPYWKDQGVEVDLKNLLIKFNEPENIELFMPFYENGKKTYYDNLKIDYTKHDMFKDTPEIKLTLFHTKNGRNVMVNLEEIENELNETSDEPYFKVIESSKFKISHPSIKHPFELFSIPTEDPWWCINKFHVGSVRGYYDGEEVYINTSALMTFQTNLSPDYRIMFGNRDPGEILLKYRRRGYGVLLNEVELGQITNYVTKVEKWKNLTKLEIKNKGHLTNFLNHQNLLSPIFKPEHCPTYSTIKKPLYIFRITDIIDSELSKLSLKLSSKNIIKEIYNINYIKINGKPNELKTWIIDAGWDLFKLYCIKNF